MEKFTHFSTSNLQPVEVEFDFNKSNLDALFVFGRGIQKRGGIWEPTDLVGHGYGPYKKHDGVYHGDIDPEDENSIVKGGKANVYATYELLKMAVISGMKLPAVYFAAGKPRYLTNENITEGEVMKSMLYELAGNEIKLPEKVLVLANAVSSYDDVRNSLETAIKEGCGIIGILSIESHLPRLRQMAKKVLYERPKINKELESVCFLNSWQILEQSGSHLADAIRYIRGTKSEVNFFPLENDAIKKLRTAGSITTEKV